jgi:hypothetical protein
MKIAELEITLLLNSILRVWHLGLYLKNSKKFYNFSKLQPKGLPKYGEKADSTRDRSIVEKMS